MRIVISEFMSLDGVVQSPGGAEEDTVGGFRHGGWSMPFVDEEVMGPAIDEMAQRTDALLYGRRTVARSRVRSHEVLLDQRVNRG